MRKPFFLLITLFLTVIACGWPRTGARTPEEVARQVISAPGEAISPARTFVTHLIDPGTAVVGYYRLVQRDEIELGYVFLVHDGANWSATEVFGGGYHRELGKAILNVSKIGNEPQQVLLYGALLDPEIALVQVILADQKILNEESRNRMILLVLENTSPPCELTFRDGEGNVIEKLVFNQALEHPVIGEINEEVQKEIQASCPPEE